MTVTETTKMRRDYHLLAGWLMLAVDHWSKHLGHPGGLGRCGRCNTQTQWSWCPVCQPVEFGRLP